MKQRVKKKILPFLAAVLAIAVTVGFIPQMAAPAYAASGDPAMSLGAGVLDQSVNSTDAQRVWYADEAWFVIGYDGNGAASESNAVTLLSVRNIDQTMFDDSGNYSNVYANSTLRKKIEGYDTEDSTHVDGILDTFSESEQGAITAKTLTSGTYDGDNTDYVAGAEVKDALLWPLSTKEANEVNEEMRIVDPEHTGWASSCWWLRSPGVRDYSSAFVYGDGDVIDDGIIVSYTYGVRPAFNLNLKSVLFTSAAEGGKSSGTEGADALKAQSDQTNSGNEWKVTVTDSAHSAFAVTKTIPSENGACVTYKDAATGTNEYVSAIITDKPITESSAKITYYGQIKNCTASGDASGTVTINTAGKLGENDHLYIFNEQCNGDKKTDYASTLQEVTIPKLISYKVTFKVKNGAWNDGSTADKTVTLSRYDNEDKALVLQDGDIPAVGNKPNTNYKAGSWDVTPSTETAISADTTYTYTYEKKDHVYYTVKFVDGQGKTLKTEKVLSGKAATAPAAPKRSGYTFTGWDKDFSKVSKNMTVTAKWKKNASQAVSGTLLAKVTAKGKSSLVLSWNEIKGAEGYDIFFIKCGKQAPKKVKTIKGNKTFKWTKTGLKKKTAYKAVVKAYVTKNGKKIYVRTSPMVHAYTSGGTKNYTNAKSVTVKKTSVSLKAGKTYTIKASVSKQNTNKKLMPKSHTAKIRYISTNKKIATVTTSGKIKGISKGTCYVYVLAHNGASKKVKVTVK